MSLTIQNVRDILSREFEIAIAQVDAVKNTSPELQHEMHEKYLIAKTRWQCLFQVHGSLMSNISWEAVFREFTEEKKYSSVEECIEQAKSYNRIQN